MESLGAKLKSARQSKGCTYEQVSRDTNIAVRYIEALETENFAAFPGEPYIIGFLRNYGDYLGLEVQELLSLYRAFKIQEQPIPVDQLLRSPPRFPKIIPVILVLVLILGAAGGGVYFFINRPRKLPAAAVTVRPAMEYILNGESADVLEQRFYRDDSILIPLGENQYKLTLSNLGDIVTITTPDDEIRLDLSNTVSVDINNDGAPDLRITLMDFAKNASGAGALLRFELAGTVPAAPPSPEAPVPPAAVSAAAAVFSSPSAFPFTLQVSFQGYCMFRYEILFERDRQDRNEQYYQRGNELNIQAQNGIRIWASNAQAAKLQVIGGGRTVPLELGGAGEVVVADVRWIRDEENRYRLVLTRLEQ